MEKYYCFQQKQLYQIYLNIDTCHQDWTGPDRIQFASLYDLFFWKTNLQLENDVIVLSDYAGRCFPDAHITTLAAPLSAAANPIAAVE